MVKYTSITYTKQYIKETYIKLEIIQKLRERSINTSYYYIAIQLISSKK